MTITTTFALISSEESFKRKTSALPDYLKSQTKLVNQVSGVKQEMILLNTTKKRKKKENQAEMRKKVQKKVSQ